MAAAFCAADKKIRMKQRIIRLSVRAIRTFGLSRLLLDTPRGIISVKEWVDGPQKPEGAEFIPVLPSEAIDETPPVVIDIPVSSRFARHYRRKSNEGFVAIIPGGRIWGEYTNIIITPDNKLLGDVSREFGAEGGRKARDFSIFHNRLRMPPVKKLSGKTAVISTSGSNNFHHWNYDVMPRLQLLRTAGLLDSVDHLLMNYRALPFQREGLRLLGIDDQKIFNSRDIDPFYLEAEVLYVPSLPEQLGTISPWVLNFLRETFLTSGLPDADMPKKLFISRRNAPSRKLINEKEVMDEIRRRGYVEFTPEDYSMQETAAYFAAARSIVSVHGSGLSNLAFVSENAKVLDIMAPYHQDPYYWMICNRRKALYVALFSEGEHPPDDFDLVKRKVDDDLLIDIHKLNNALDLVS
jgi:hypothetical protein